MVAEERGGPDRLGEVDHLRAVGPPVHQVPQEHDPVLGLQLELVEQLEEFIVASVDVADGDEASGHESFLCRQSALRRKFAIVHTSGEVNKKGLGRSEIGGRTLRVSATLAAE